MAAMVLRKSGEPTMLVSNPPFSTALDVYNYAVWFCGHIVSSWKAAKKVVNKLYQVLK